jgi:hypothetical protein
MGWRFRRGVRVLPGVRLNISKRGLSSVSIGRRGLTLNVSRRGMRETVGLPGTGLSYTTPTQHPSTSAETEHVIGWLAVILIVLIAAAVVAVIAT